MSSRRTLACSFMVILAGCGGTQSAPPDHASDANQPLDAEVQTPAQLDGTLPEGDPPTELDTTTSLDAEVQQPTQLDGMLPEGDPPVELGADSSPGEETADSPVEQAQDEGAAADEIGASAIDTLAGADEAATDRPAEDPAEQGPPNPDRVCTYDMYNWSVDEGRSVNHRHVETTVGELADDEIDPNDPRCTVCSEDQVRINPADHGWPSVDSFEVCVHYEAAVIEALEAIAETGDFEIREVTGYRSGRTRGRVENGMRMEMSNHAYGTAIDINARYNGLYGSCYGEVTPDSIDDCSLRVGGEWDPDSRPDLTITRDSSVYELFTGLVGWRWGGEIDGSTKDMMHFSLDGY